MFQTGVRRPVGPAYRKQLELTIRRYGWVCQGVLDDGSGFPGWFYTIGLADQSRPEMIVIRLAHDTAREIFTQVIEEADLAGGSGRGPVARSTACCAASAR